MPDISSAPSVANYTLTLRRDTPYNFPQWESIKSILIIPAHHAVVPRGLRSRVAADGTGNTLPPLAP